MSISKESFEEKLGVIKKRTEEWRIRFDTLAITSTTSQVVSQKDFSATMTFILQEISNIQNLIEKLYEDEIAKHKPMWAIVEKWVNAQVKEDAEKRKFR